MFDRRLVHNFDWGLLCLTLLLAGMGLIVLYSAVTAGGHDAEKILYYKQMIWYAIGFGVMAIMLSMDYKNLERYAPMLYSASILLLVCVLVFGKHVGGSRRWLSLGPVSIQPSEFVKIAVIIILSRTYAKLISSEGLSFRELIKPMILVLIPFALIVRQPDLGTAMVVVFIAGSITLFVKIQRLTLWRLILACLVSAPLIWGFMLKGYQKQRVLTFLDPSGDPLNSGYHIIQSKIAIGSGMITGKGFLKGTQNMLSFLPEQHTDFIFSVLAEEWGFLGSIFLLSVFLILILWGLNIAWQCRDPFGMVLAVGVTAMIFWQTTINIGMVMGLMPVVGVPLPFISYGGSSVISIMICVGILMSVSIRCFIFE
jgi:rod shape determining protein RodA